MKSSLLSFGVILSVAALAVPACSSSSGGGGLETDDAGSSSGSDSTSGSGSGSSGSGSAGSGKGSGSSSGSGANCGQVSPTTIMYSGSNGAVECGTACDLKTNTCCLGLTSATCATGHNGCTGTLTAAFECVQETDCPTGQVCCGYADGTTGTAGSKCQDVSKNGGKCSPAPTSTMGSVQFCQNTCECKDGSTCTAQSCAIPGSALPAQLTMCGVQKEQPYNCTAN